MITITTPNFSSLTTVLEKVVRAIDTTEILDEAQASLLNRTKQRFLAQESPDGSKWTPSQASLNRAKKGIGGGTLFDTGTLFGSLQAYAISGDTRGLGTDVPYAKKHQTGYDNVPARVFLGFNDEDLNVFEGIVISRVEESLK